jgi:hypothetical protein
MSINSPGIRQVGRLELRPSYASPILAGQGRGDSVAAEDDIIGIPHGIGSDAWMKDQWGVQLLERRQKIIISRLTRELSLPLTEVGNIGPTNSKL